MSDRLRDGTVRLKAISDWNREAWRTDAQIDVDRILYSPEFRRLSGVTQVVPPEDDYHFHDRLSHSIKVAQVASTLARMLVLNAEKDDAFSQVALDDWVDPDHCYAAALAHDIGHPPFGHAGEEALQGLLDSIRDIEFWEPDEADHPGSTPAMSDGHRLADRSFEGNAQSTRVVSRLSFRGDEFNVGLNLTLRTLAGIAKYPWLKGGHPVSLSKLANKWSFYPEESYILERLVEQGFVLAVADDEGTTVKVHRWVETEIMDWADDISYAVHDIDDFYRARLIPLGQIMLALERCPRDLRNTEKGWSKTDFKFVDDSEIQEALQYISAKLKAFQERSSVDSRTHVMDEEFDAAFSQLLKFAPVLKRTSNFNGTEEALGDLRRFSSQVIRYLSSAATLGFDPNTGRVQLYIKPEAVLVAEFFKGINSYFVIDSVNLAAMQEGQETKLHSLFFGLFNLASKWLTKLADGKASGRLPARLRSNFKAQIDGVENPDEGMMAIAVLDYIASLRDGQAAHLAAQLDGSLEMPTVASAWLNS
ncbi:deoxyguanosinetriphosphate triphosphohydrolase family protein [Aestuariimicrobium sp. Y1814]|uniref:deoxyguanosinetriphosphate triphosphohydrolase family protein n=1 Tax=Aestuariimicrobium sp. Y1814 TaxID=3418742 RepID=UPI003DA6E220